MKTVLAVLILLPFLVDYSDTVLMRYIWTRPTTGTPVQHYVVQHKIEDGGWIDIGTTTEEEYYVPLVRSRLNWVRVAGVDSLGRQGMFSVPSDPFDPATSGVPTDYTIGIGDVAVAKSTGCFRGR